MRNIYELLVRRCTQTTERIQFVTSALVCTQELDVKTLLPKTLHTLGVKHKEFNVELLEVLSCSASLHCQEVLFCKLLGVKMPSVASVRNGVCIQKYQTSKQQVHIDIILVWFLRNQPLFGGICSLLHTLNFALRCEHVVKPMDQDIIIKSQWEANYIIFAKWMHYQIVFLIFLSVSTHKLSAQYKSSCRWLQ